MEEKEIMTENKDSLKISDEVISVITGVAASETEGVASVGHGGFATSWTELIGAKKNNAKGIKVVMGESSVTIELQIVVNYGVRITDIAANVQENVKNAVEEMTGLSVERVDVRVVGIKTAAEEKKNDDKSVIEDEVKE